MITENKVISFPHLGKYHIPVEYFLRHTLPYEIKTSPPITKKTLELGTKYSPDFVCIPFKYNLGNFIEALDNGANILIQAGGGCRYGYYAEVQHQILIDLGYDFEFYCLVSKDKVAFINMYHVLKKIYNKLSIFKYFYYLLIGLLMIYFMDRIDIYIRENIGFEEEPNSFDNLLQRMLVEFKNTKGIFDLIRIYRKYNKLFRKLKVNKPSNCFKIGVVGELYTSMEPFSSYFIEKSLAKMKIQVTRFTDLTYLLITKRFQIKKLLKVCGKYCRYELGADGMDNIARSRMLIDKGYDGLIHIKPFGCTPEIGAISVLQRLSNDFKIPIIYLTFDSHTSEEGVKTRLEAFYDMIKMRRGKY